MLHATFHILTIVFISPSSHPMQCRRIYLVIQALRVVRLPISLHSNKFRNLLFMFINCGLGTFFF